MGCSQFVLQLASDEQYVEAYPRTCVWIFLDTTRQQAGRNLDKAQQRSKTHRAEKRTRPGQVKLDPPTFTDTTRCNAHIKAQHLHPQYLYRSLAQHLHSPVLWTTSVPRHLAKRLRHFYAHNTRAHVAPPPTPGTAPASTALNTPASRHAQPVHSIFVRRTLRRIRCTPQAT